MSVTLPLSNYEVPPHINRALNRLRHVAPTKHYTGEFSDDALGPITLEGSLWGFYAQPTNQLGSSDIERFVKNDPRTKNSQWLIGCNFSLRVVDTTPTVKKFAGFQLFPPRAKYKLLPLQLMEARNAVYVSEEDSITRELWREPSFLFDDKLASIGDSSVGYQTQLQRLISGSKLIEHVFSLAICPEEVANVSQQYTKNVEPVLLKQLGHGLSEGYVSRIFAPLEERLKAEFRIE